MAKLCSVYSSLILLFISGTLMVTVAGDNCEENIGVCSDQCSFQCISLHPGGQGFCKFDGAQNSCACYYECEAQICEINLAPTEGCDDEHCDHQCASKFPGKGASGFCYGVLPYLNTCNCKYFC